MMEACDQTRFVSSPGLDETRLNSFGYATGNHAEVCVICTIVRVGLCEIVSPDCYKPSLLIRSLALLEKNTSLFHISYSQHLLRR